VEGRACPVLDTGMGVKKMDSLIYLKS